MTNLFDENYGYASYDSYEAFSFEERPVPIEERSGALNVSQAIQWANNALKASVLTIEGEVSELTAASGYKSVYFTLKDGKSVLPAKMWKDKYHACGVEMRIGMKVIVTGKFDIWAAKGRMSFDVYSIKAAGAGDLRQQVADLAEKLRKEGLMDSVRKRKIPRIPHTIGLVTSPRGAAVADVLRTLRRRYPAAVVKFAGVPVEGAQAPKKLIEALHVIEQSGAQVVLLVRGGGSFEDLMPFNDEGLARTIADLAIPVVTGIGHEPDNSIADMVADVRASTPTGAAETVVPDAQELLTLIQTRAERMNASFVQSIEHYRVQLPSVERLSLLLSQFVSRERAHIDAIASRPVLRDPHVLLANAAQLLDYSTMRFNQALPKRFEQERARLRFSQNHLASVGAHLSEPFAHTLASAAMRLNDLSPLQVVARGYAIARDSTGHIVSHVDDVHSDDELSIRVSDGMISARVLETDKSPLSASVDSSTR